MRHETTVASKTYSAGSPEPITQEIRAPTERGQNRDRDRDAVFIC